jgi:hypothetical protein
MPLAFRSIDHGVVAFGFFNIDTDLLLLERTLVWGEHFTTALGALAAAAPDALTTTTLPAFRVPPERSLGNVMGAIQGFDRGGFIGAVYDRFPFPEDPAAFRQRPEVAGNRAAITALLEQWAEPSEQTLVHDPGTGLVTVAGITFEAGWFRDLVAYVWRGGYPRWLDERRPQYVVEMRRAIEDSSHPLFREQPWEMQRCRT